MINFSETVVKDEGWESLLSETPCDFRTCAII